MQRGEVVILTNPKEVYLGGKMNGKSVWTLNLQHDFNQRRAGVADEGLQKPCRHDLSHGPKGPDTLGRKRLPCRMLPSRSGEGLVGSPSIPPGGVCGSEVAAVGGSGWLGLSCQHHWGGRARWLCRGGRGRDSLSSWPSLPITWPPSRLGLDRS